jgi:hypothetical protein
MGKRAESGGHSAQFRSPFHTTALRFSGSKHYPLAEKAMVKIVIKDLAQNVELDRQAMLAITGGARVGSGANFIGNRIAAMGCDTALGLSGFAGRSWPERPAPATLKTLLK